ncbi:MAG TPA: cupin domain-containing protein [Lacunisphaera sp.]|jgi:uncharacterized cupin superfamily protein
MKHIHLDSVPWEEVYSPTRKFHSFCRNVSIAMGAPRNTGLWGGGHPFDVQIRRIPPGAAVCPFHSHLAQSELFVVQTGSGTARVGDDTHAINAGDVFYQPPGEPHQLINSGSDELIVLIIADNPQLDACYYPDSKKWGLRPPGKFFRMVECDYLDGEDAPPPEGVPTYKPAPAAAAPALAPFAQRKVSIDELSWENFDSPKRKFRSDSKDLSAAIGAKRNTPTGLGGHPFDLELGRVPPGFSGCPFHSHSSQWEFYIFLSGQATVRTTEKTLAMGAGDIVLHPPGEAHQFTNTGTDDLLYFLVADNPTTDVWHYPDSGKMGVNSPRRFFHATDVDYWEGEE